MRIISKYKDYYDYLQYQYGIDPLLTLVRNKDNVGKRFENLYFLDKKYYGLKKIVFNICDYSYHCLIDSNGKLYYGEDLKRFSTDKKDINYSDYILGGRYSLLDNNYNGFFIKVQEYYRGSEYDFFPMDRIKRIKEDDDNEIISIKVDNYYIHDFPILDTFNFGSILTPQEIWIELSNYLAKEKQEKENIEDKQTNKEKILNKGFDLKKSFRHR